MRDMYSLAKPLSSNVKKAGKTLPRSCEIGGPWTWVHFAGTYEGTGSREEEKGCFTGGLVRVYLTDM